MELNAYQNEAYKSDKVPGTDAVGMIVPLLGLAGEAGELLSEYKKHLRDGDDYTLFRERVSEELGDLLWYVSNVATKFGIELEQIAEENLKKSKDQWIDTRSEQTFLPISLFDAKYPISQRLPRQMQVEISETLVNGKRMTRMLIDGKNVGDPLTDNSRDSDGYRFHDIFHLAYAAVLGWSPVLRKLLKAKRSSDSITDEVEDGGRAIVIEEGISAMVFSHARSKNYYRTIKRVDYEILRTIKSMTSHLEVKNCSTGEWQRAILLGYKVWNEVEARNGGVFSVDLDRRTITEVDSSREQSH